MIRSTQEKDRLFQQIREYLDYESVHLAETLKSIKKTRTKMLNREFDAIHHDLPSVQEHELHRLRLSEQRATIQERISVAFGLPLELANVSQVIRRFNPSQRKELTLLQKNLQELAMSVDILNRGNALFVSKMFEVLENAIETLSGQPSTTVYEKSGRVRKTAVASTVRNDL